jgi:tetratricopeptide (TPR) repeat protein
MRVRDNQPEARAELLDAMGTICRGSGEYELALVYLNQAILIRRQLGPAARRTLADSLVQYGWLQRETAHYPEAEAAFREALTLNDGQPADRRFFAVTEFHLAWILADRGSLEDPKLLKEGLNRFQAVAKQLKEISGDDSRDHAVALMGLAIAYFANGQDQTAMQTMFLSQARFEAKNSESQDPASKVASLYLAATIARKEGKPDTAERHFREAIELADKIVGERHPFLKLPLAFIRADYAGLLRSQNKLSSAEKVARQALDTIRHSPLRGHLEVIRAMIQFADRLRERATGDDLSEAEEFYTEAAQFGKVSLGVNHPFVQDAQAKLESLQQQLNKGSPK